ncbi:Zinc/iron permease [Chytriomyces sp. MP71]|nr:Zinc/iron permease [Chytriomyces sp. MP71]KAI8619955.1 Zinc/iron permease [Chytriomyces sp. MP71]
MSSDNSTSATDACASTLAGQNYNEGLHVGGGFAVLATSSLGAFGTMLLAKNPSLLLLNVLQLCKMFGIGVIAATAWIHLLPDAFSQFGSPCLPEGWASYGPNYVGLFGLIAAFIVQLIETGIVVKKSDANESHKDHNHHETAVHEASDATVVREQSPIQYSRGDKETSVILLETGILFHSLIIGITLGVTPDDGFSSLLAAVCFHQLFEGMALGVLIGNLNFQATTRALLCLLYPLTTPLGIGIGIGVRNFYNGNSGSLIVTQGIFDSLSAGILFYNTYTELMSEEISHNTTFYKFQAKFKAACFFAMYLGAAAMAVVGIWA